VGQEMLAVVTAQHTRATLLALHGGNTTGSCLDALAIGSSGQRSAWDLGEGGAGERPPCQPRS
jgi:hypothetical protein